MHQPFLKGVSLFEQAKPIAQILGEMAALLAEVKEERMQIKTPETSEGDSEDEE